MEELMGVVCTRRDKSVSMMPYSIPLEAVACAFPEDDEGDDGGLKR